MKRSNKKEAKRKRNNLIAGLVMLFLMVGSIIAFSIDSAFQRGETFEFNNFTFKQEVVFDEMLYGQDIMKYTTLVNDEEVQFFYPPGMMSQVNLSEENLSVISDANMVLFARAPIESEFELDINLLLFESAVYYYNEYSQKMVSYGLTNYTDFESDVMLVDCEMASSSGPVFILSNFSASPSIREVEPFCFEISAQGENFLMLSDYLLYKTHRVI